MAVTSIDDFEIAIENCDTIKITDDNDYTGETIVSVAFAVTGPDDTSATNVTIGTPPSPLNGTTSYTPTNFSQTGSTFSDGVYTFVFTVTFDVSSTISKTYYFLNLCNIDACIADKVETAILKKCACREYDFTKIKDMRIISTGIQFNFTEERFTRVADDLEVLEDMCDTTFNCNCGT